VPREIDLSKKAAKFLAHLDGKQKRQILSTLDRLAEIPRPHDSSQLKDITPPMYRVDMGEFRIAYEFDDVIITVHLIDKRNDDAIYRKLKRRKG
jgi:mRNA interferase RelE/StbE